VIAMPAVDGKLTIAAIMDALNNHSGEHMVQPKMVYISDTTELGTIYTKAELTAIHDLCSEKDLILFLDGARMGSALTCKTNDLKLKDIAQLVDVFYIGGTKNGALLGEALVIGKKELKEDFRYLMKQRGAMMAKGFVIGIQFEALFMTRKSANQFNTYQDNLYYELGYHANAMAEKIAEVLQRCGYSFYAPICSNQLFPILPNDVIDRLAVDFKFMVQAKIDEKQSAIRFVTSWATTEENVEKLIEFFIK